MLKRGIASVRYESDHRPSLAAALNSTRKEENIRSFLGQLPFAEEIAITPIITAIIRPTGNTHVVNKHGTMS